jgi:hypothetical protein
MTKASKCIKLKPSISSLKPWESDGISRNAWYRKGRLAAAQLDVVGPGSGDRSASGQPFDYAGLTRKQTAELVLFRIATGELPATPARVAACKELIRLSRDGVDPQIDSGAWADVLEDRS